MTEFSNRIPKIKKLANVSVSNDVEKKLFSYTVGAISLEGTLTTSIKTGMQIKFDLGISLSRNSPFRIIIHVHIDGDATL